MLTITVDNGAMSVASPFNREFAEQARHLGGKWNLHRKTWDFPRLASAQVFALLNECYGYSFSGVDHHYVLDLRIPESKDSDELTLVGRPLITRRTRDASVTWGDGVILLSGKVPSSGGSARHPRIGHREDLVVRVFNWHKPYGVGQEVWGYVVEACVPQAEFEAEEAASYKEVIVSQIHGLEAKLADLRAQLEAE